MEDVRQFLKRVIDGYLLADLDNMAGIRVQGDGNCGYPMVMSVLAGMELLGALTFPHPFDPDKARAEGKDVGKEHFGWYWKHFLAQTPGTTSGYSTRGDMSGLIRTLIRNGLAHVFLAKPGIEVRKAEPALHMTSQAPGTLFVDCTQFATDFRRSYETYVRPILEGQPRRIKDHTISLQTMQAQLGRMTQHYSKEATDCFSRVSGPIPASPPTQSGITTGSANFPGGGTVTITYIVSSSLQQ